MGGFCRRQWLFSRISAETAREIAGPMPSRRKARCGAPDGGLRRGRGLMLMFSKNDPKAARHGAVRLPEDPI